jgi:hypothetical protein
MLRIGMAACRVLMPERLVLCLSCVLAVLAVVKLARLIKMCLTEMYSRVRVGENLSDKFQIRKGLKQGDAVFPLLCNFALEYAIRRVG